MDELSQEIRRIAANVVNSGRYPPALLAAEIEAAQREEERRVWFIAYGATRKQANELISLARRLPTQSFVTMQVMKEHISSGVPIEAVIVGYRAMVNATSQHTNADPPPDLE